MGEIGLAIRQRISMRLARNKKEIKRIESRSLDICIIQGKHPKEKRTSMKGLNNREARNFQVCTSVVCDTRTGWKTTAILCRLRYMVANQAWENHPDSAMLWTYDA